MAIFAMVVLAAAGAFSLNAHAQCNIYMSTNQQAIDGYGFSSAWSGTLTTAKNNALYGTLGMSLLRVRIDGGNNWGEEIANAAAAHAAGVKVFGTVWFAPGQWLDANNYLLPEHYADYANWLSLAATAHNLDWVSPANEPDLGWGQWTSDEYKSWIGQYGGSLGAPLLAPESCYFSDTFGNPILDDTNAGPNISIYGGHYYGNGPAVHQDALDKGKHVWMTEYYFDGMDDLNTCMNIGQQINDSMNCQLSAYVWWWVNDSDTNVNLVASDGTIHKNGYTIGQFAKWIRPGSTRVTANYTPSAGVSVTAYNVNGSAVIVAVNTNTTGSVNQQFAIHNGSAAALEGYRTSSSQSMADIGSFTVASGSFTANLPAQSITTFVQTNGTPPNLPPPWSAQDIGAVGIVGSSTYTNSVVTNGVFTVTASGSDIWNTSDAFRFVYETNGGNCTIIARVSSEPSTNANAKAGVMIRNSLNPGAANAFIGVTPSNGVVFQYRSSTGGSSSSNRVTGLSAPYWVKLVQSGSTVAGYYSANGTSWTQLGTTTTISLGFMQTNAWGQVSGPVEYAGLAFCNNGNASLGTAAFDNVSAPGWPLPAPSAPTGLTATGGVEQVTLNWQAGSYATNYIIKRATVSGGPYTTIATSWRGTSYIDYGLVGGTTYYYVVMAVNGIGQSTNSTQAGATPTANVPSPWLGQDIGSVGLYGSESFTNGVFTVTASGNDIWDTADAFRFVYVPVTNNCTIIARVASLQNVDGWSKAGVMIRASLASNAPNAFVAVTPGNGVTWQCRSSTNGSTVNAGTGGLSAPYWVKLVRSGNVFTGYVSPDGTNWTQQGTATFTMATNAYVGLAVTAHNNSDLCAATFDHVTGPGWTPPSASTPAGLVATAGIEQVALSWMATSNANAGYNVYRATTSGGPYSNVGNVTTTNYTDTGLNDRTTYYYVVTAVNSLAGESANSAQVSATTTVPVPYPWLTRDVGSVGLAGSASFTNGVFTVTGSGADIQGTADAFRFVYVATNSGNCSIIARVASLQNIDGWSKAGVMIRDSLNPGAANVFVAVTPGNGATFQYRSSDGGGCNYSTTSGSAPYWVKLVQSSGTNFTGYCSPDGTNWTQAGSATLTGVTTAYIGLAVTAHNNSALCTATFDNVSFTAITPASLQLVSNWGPFVPTTGDGPISMYVYVPTNVVANPPILIELHYCGGTGPGVFGWAGGLKAAADQYGFIIVAPSANDTTGTNARCWNPSSTNALTRYGGGDTQAIVSMVNYAATNYHANTNRVYLVGVSSGAMMTEALLAVYPDVFTAGSEFSGIPAGADGWGGDQMSLTPQQWGNMVRAMYPGYSGYRPRIQLWHGTADTTVSYTNQPEAIKEWSNVLGLSTNANYTETVTISGITNQWTHQVWEDPCSDTILEAWTEINGPHMTDAPWNAQYVIPFLGLNQTGATDPVIMTCGVPTSLSAVAIYWNQVSLTWNGLAGATGYNIKRSTISGGPYTLIASGMTTNNFTDTGVTVSNGYYYVVSAIVGGSETGNSLEAAIRFPKLTGTIIGTAGSWGGAGNTISNVFDNNLNTYFDAPSADGAWVGLDFGVGVTNVITQINYCPRSTLEWRMTNGVFQGANNTNFTGAVTLFTITNTPATGVFTSVTIANLTAFRCVRYLSPNGSWGNVSELEFYGYRWPSGPAPSAPTGLAAAAISTSQINLTWNTVANAASYNVKRSTTNGGPYVIIATGVTATNYNDTGLAAATTYYYVASAVNAGGESTNSTAASATTLMAAPTAPVSLTATTISTNQINLVWNAVTNAATYNVKRSTTNGGTYTVIATGVTATNYNDTGLAAATTYYYVVSGANAGGEGVNSSQATAATLSPFAYSWGSPVSFAGLNAGQILTNFPGTAVVAAMFAQNGGSSITVTLGGSSIVFAPANTSWAGLSGGNGYTTGASTNSTGNANFDSCLNAFYYDTGPHLITLSNLMVGRQYSVQLFALDDRSGLSPAGSARTVNWQNPADSSNVSATYSMADNKYIVLTFVASNAVQVIQENLLNSGYGNFNCLVLRAVMVPGTVTLGNLSQTYDGTAKSASATTTPSGLTVNLTYNGSANAPTNAGSYTVIGTITDVKYQGCATNTLVISKGTGTVNLVNLSQTYNGTARSVTATTTPTNLTVNITYNGFSDAPTNAGSYTVIGTISDANYQGSATNTLVISKAAGAVTLGNLSQTYDGTAKSASATTTPTNLTVNLTYNGSANAPTNAGSYTVIGTINDANYQGSATNTLVISKAIPPQVSLALVGTNLMVSWSQTNTGFTVQYCTDLMLGNWLNITSPAPQTVGSQWQVVLPPANAGPVFYRLMK